MAFAEFSSYDAGLEIFLWGTNLPSFKLKVEALFQRLYSMIKETPLDENAAGSDFLKSLHTDARTNSRNWQERLDVYLHCLADRGAINAAQVNVLLELASECPMPAPPTWSFFSPALWILVGAVSVLGWSTYSLGRVQLLVFMLIVVLAGGYTGWILYSRPYRQPPRSSHIKLQVFIVVAMAAIAVFFATIIPAMAKECYFAYVMHEHGLDVKRFAAAPDGLATTQKMAKQEFGINVVLNYPENNWVQTALALPGSSPASVNTAPGYCLLNINSKSLAANFDLEEPKLRSSWLEGVLIHEIFHCRDLERDLRTLDGHHKKIATHSLAPSGANSITDLYSYIEASQEDSTKLWREAYADIAAIGYWKIRAPADAETLISALHKKRADSTYDTVHQTTCWIEHARQGIAPLSLAQLPDWADEIRNGATCNGV